MKVVTVLWNYDRRREIFRSGNQDELRRAQKGLRSERKQRQGLLQEAAGGVPSEKQCQGGLERASLATQRTVGEVLKLETGNELKRNLFF